MKTWALLVVLMLPIALSIHYARIDPKLPSQTWLWALNNLFFVCVAEESLFRGLIQCKLTKLVPQSSRWKWLPLAISSLLFGLNHYEGGLTYILLATIAGLIFGRIQLIGLLWILLCGLTIWSAVNPSLSKWVRWLSMGIFLVIGVAMSNHLLPGFNNLLVIDRVQFSSDSAPFTIKQASDCGQQNICEPTFVMI